MLLAVTWLAGHALATPTVPAASPRITLQLPQAVADSPIVAPRVVRAVRAARPLSVDGTLSDPIWQTAERVTGFEQRDPNEGAAPTESTVVYVAYDGAALYVAARMYDAHPDSIVGRLGRRDAMTNSDQFTVFVDPYHDRRSGYYFGVDAAGTLSDGTLYNDDWNDNTWDGVWEGKATRDALGWIAEFRIPFSQLRFIQRPEYVWGINFRRDIARKNEKDYLVYTPKNGAGFVSRFVDLVGIERVTPPPRVEILPYTTGKAEFAPRTPGNPFAKASSLSPGAGGDARIGLGPNLTLNATVNPDFGQVEVDPAVVNLSDVETFFQEKRPFFVEGSSIFDFGHGGANNYWGFNWGEPRFFYSRRIGRAPQGTIPVGANSDSSFADAPPGVHILGALKLTGKAGSSWNVGALSAITARETAWIDTSHVIFRKEVEPLAYYGVFRAQKEFPVTRRRELGRARLRDRRLDVSGPRQRLGAHRLGGGHAGERRPGAHHGRAAELAALLPATGRATCAGRFHGHRPRWLGGPDLLEQTEGRLVLELRHRRDFAGVRRARPRVPVPHRDREHAHRGRPSVDADQPDLPVRRARRCCVPELRLGRQHHLVGHLSFRRLPPAELSPV
jgi:hypothetical protein